MDGKITHNKETNSQYKMEKKKKRCENAQQMATVINTEAEIHICTSLQRRKRLSI